ncbi:MAG: ribonuclease Z [Candidatus Pacearchaeota archaeon]|nr:ribonuclease Z [Candidatus Pacearchaeota archaeon]
MDFEIIFLGTGSAIPTAKHNHTGILVKTPKENILVDCGEGIQRQFKIAKENPCKLTRLLITHWHADHALGIPGLIYSMGLNNYSKTLQIYGPEGTAKKLSSLQYIYNKFKIKYEVNEITKKVFESPELLIEALPMKHHNTTTFAYSIIIKDKTRLDKEKLKKLNLPNSPILKKLQEGKDIIHPKTKKKIKASSVIYTEKGKKITIILDTAVNPNTIKISQSADLLICESSFAEDEEARAKESYHLTTKQAAEIAKKAKVKQLVLTHISQKHEIHPEALLLEAKKIFKNTIAVKDFDKLKI